MRGLIRTVGRLALGSCAAASEIRGSASARRFNSTEFFRARSQKLQGIDPFPPKYRFNTWGANLGGPVMKNQKKLFFFYSMEAPLVKRPQSVQTWRMPSALERVGNFSQTFDAQGRLINIRDPRKVGLACNAVSGGPGCFDGNIIPASMINPNHMQAMLKLMPLPEYDPRTTQGNYNYDTEEVIDIPKLNNIARLDWRPTSTDSFSFTFKDWWQDQHGARITAGPSNWQWFFAHYKNTDRGFSGNYTKILKSTWWGHRLAGGGRGLPPLTRRVDQSEPHEREHGPQFIPGEPARRPPEIELRPPADRRTVTAGVRRRGLADVRRSTRRFAAAIRSSPACTTSTPSIQKAKAA